MDTKQYIDVLKNKSHKPIPVAMRHALIYYLYKENIACSIIAEIMGRTRRVVYMNIYKAMDLIEIGDKIMKASMDEVKKHHIAVRPYSVPGDVIARHMGYKLIIDNIVY